MVKTKVCVYLDIKKSEVLTCLWIQHTQSNVFDVFGFVNFVD